VRGEPAGRGFRVLHEARLGSTNDLARELAEAGEPEGLIVTAREQTGGRGRHGRRWQSPPGNFYGSLILRPETSLAAAASLSLVVALAALNAIEALAGGRRPLDLAVKWPNDVLLAGAKVAGILLEGAVRGDRAGVGCAWVVAGLGVNLAWHPALPHYPSTSLAEHGIETTPERFLDAYLRELGRLLPDWRRRGFAPFREAWLARALGLGGEISLRVGSTLRRGRFQGLDADGSILIETAPGSPERFATGELFFGDLALAASPLAGAARNL
jgi:BirA family biotin operon repressor/biotin-[acetyl-CoA-carboxylase] ligase